jgi:hypothetical protein
MTRTRLVLALSATLAAGGLAASTAPAAAMPGIDPGVATAADIAQVKPEAVRYVCDAWGRCWWRPNVYRRYYAPRPYYGRGFYGHPGWGHRGWRRW